MFIQARDIQKIEKTEAAVTAGCRNTAALVFLTENLSCRRALSAQTSLFSYQPTRARQYHLAAVSLLSKPGGGSKRQCCVLTGRRKGYLLLTNGMANVKVKERGKKEEKRKIKTIWSHCHK